MAAFAIGTTGAHAATPAEDLQAALDQVVTERWLVPGASAYVDAPRMGLPWTGAAGEFAEGSGRPLSPEDPFRIASVHKVFTAAAVLRLVEEGRLDLEQPVAPFLDADQVERMHVHGGVNYGREITIRQLLQHTSGLNSHDECNEFTAAVATGPRRRWSPRDQIELMIDCGDPYFPPGTPGGYHYSDTGYVMLGTVLAEVTGKDHAAALRELLPLEALGVHRTWHELLEPERADARPRAHQYYSAVDLTNWDPSFDSWGGGGYVSTVEELSRFIRALFEGRVFERRSTLRTMTRAIPTGAGGPYEPAYGLGVRLFTYDGVRCIGHTGFWSSAMNYCPSLDLAFALTTNQASDEQMRRAEGPLTRAIIDIVKRAPAARASLTARPGRVRVDRRRRFRLRLTANGRPIGGAVVKLGGRRAETDASGLARLAVRFRRPGVRIARACKEGVGCTTDSVRVTLPPGTRRGAARP